jgi:hypothetical protein
MPRSLSTISDRGMECCPVPDRTGKPLFSADRRDQRSWWISVWDPVKSSEDEVAHLNLEGAWQWPSSLDSKGGTLFLNSMKRPDTHGMDDIYISFSSNGSWSAPVNAGPAVNTKEYEDGAILSPDQEWLIFCRHETASTPSRVLAVKWKPFLQALRMPTP